MAITHLVDGAEALRIEELAARHDMSPEGMRTALRREHVEPVDHCGRAPLYLPEVVDAKLAARPNRGAPGRPRRRAGAAPD